MRRHLTAAITLSLALVSTAKVAHAGGLEYAGGGTAALGRGGANAARADTPMVLRMNPAGLAELRGSQLMINLDYARMDACFTGAGYYGWGSPAGYGTAELTDPKTGESVTLELANPDSEEAKAYYRDPYDKVCLDQVHTPIPNLAFSLRLTERLGIGAGLIFPVVTPQGTWGSENGVIRGDEGDLRPAPSRYMMIRSNSLGLFPTVGVGYRLADWFRIGGAFEWGMFAVSNTQASATDSGLVPHKDVLARVSAEDFFVPAFNLSVHLVPVDALDVVLGFRYQDDIDATGRLNATTGVFQPTLNERDNRLEAQSIQQSMPWKLWAGIRFADRINPRPEGTGADEGEGAPGAEPVHDPLQDENWDIEIDAVYEMNSRVRGQDVDWAEGQFLYVQGTDGNERATNFPDSTTPPTFIRKDWQDQVSLRVGGSYNFVPGVFGVSAGAHYENRGVNPNLMQLDFWPVERFGVHAGFTVRLAGSVDLSFAYAHIFQETIIVAPPAHNPTAPGGFNKGVGVITEIGGTQDVVEEQPQGEPDGVADLRQTVTRAPSALPVIMNAGKYESSIDVFSLGLQMHF